MFTNLKNKEEKVFEMETKPAVKSVNERVKEGIILSIILTIAIFTFSMVSGRLGLVNVWAGCMFFWYWANVDHFKMDHIVENIVGSLVGILLCFGLYYVLHNYGMSVFEIAMIAVLLVVLFFCITEFLPIILNKATFLFITVLTAHQFLTECNYLDLLISYAFGAVWFMIILGLAFKVLGALAVKKTA
ncbi:hypothetical protein [Acetobacterium bakii]|uniref:hypothetical protein n=1 Tax=Acetobacterium bakii TaxID=52689 RepID=UPI001364AE6A|nr:hypothetical protein [Acetobacterium bakii]